MNRFLLPLALLTTVATAAESRAETGDPRAYALVVGANRGGAGQDVLQFAERDAANVAAVLESVGRYPAGNVTTLRQPSPAQLRRALRRVSARLAQHQKRGEKTTFLFYYSGHSRAAAINLAGAELPLAELRSELEQLPATLKIVVLDACQSGKFSRVKGIDGAADFSVNSINDLAASGMAVMASSSGSELSQESERLGASYFTHYLLVALRGAGDGNRDGRVTLDEAYRYAYNRTLAATAVTAVGKQHVTLETDLVGKGEIPLSFPARSRTVLVLRPAAAGDYLIQARPSGSVIAEVHKIAGEPVRLAIAAGSYRVIVRQGDRARACRAEVAPGSVTVFSPAQCVRIEIESTARKGDRWLRQPTWGFEALAGFGVGVDDAFTSRLGNFGYERTEDLLTDNRTSGHFELTATRYIGSLVHLTGSFVSLGGDNFFRDGDTETERFEYSSRALIGGARLTYPLTWRYPTGRWGGLIPFADLGVGVVHSKTRLRIGEMPPSSEDHWGYTLSAAAGGQLMFLPAFGLIAKARYAVAPTIDNLLGETHDVGGWFFGLGVRGAFE